MLKKYSLAVVLIALISLSSMLLVGQSSYAESGNEVAQNAAYQLDNQKIEYVKIKYADGQTEEHWRDVQNLLERTDNRDSKGNLINTILVMEKGKRVINIGNENGDIEAFTWVLPEKIADINKDQLKKSILEDVINELNSEDWKQEGNSFLMDGRKVKKIKKNQQDFNQVIYIDENTGFPIKREIYGDDGSLKEERIEEYKKIDDDSAKLFEHNNVELKEISAPVVNGEPGIG